MEYTYDAWGNILSVTGSLASTLGQANPFRYRGYYYDSETGFYYLNSRYYDPSSCRFISTDVLLDTSDAIGCNLYAYCGNDPINHTDYSGAAAEAAAETALRWWIRSMWWLCGADTALPVGEIIYIAGAGLFLLTSLIALSASDENVESSDEKRPENNIPPDFDDPTKAPDGYEWRGGKDGGYYNPDTGESLHPDLNHPKGVPPHWDYNYRGSGHKGWRIFREGIELK